MTKLKRRIFPFACLVSIMLSVCWQILAAENNSVSMQPLNWPVPMAENRPASYWWWMGSAVNKKNITWNLETMRNAGIGGGMIVPIYGVKGYEEKQLYYLTPKWVDMMTFASKEAKRLGMWVDMTTGTGWPFGGPMISDADSDATVVYDNGKLSQKFSGRMVKRAAPGGNGKALNPYSPKSLTAYLKYFDQAFNREDVVLPRAMYHDSFEYLGNWCREFPEEFRKRRGYDLTKYLPALFSNGDPKDLNIDPETVARIKSDYRETLSDLHLEYIQTWVKWAGKKGCTTRNQAHGAPANLLDLYAASGIPETEIFGASKFNIPGIRLDKNNVDGHNHPQPLINLMASSAAHVSGKTLISAEACTWVRNHFRAALSQVKPEIDQLFLNGVNHIFFHGTCYSPEEAPWPGWLFYASLQYNPRNAIWRDSSYLNAYITRCQSILQSGKPDNDVALYWPVYDIWHSANGMQQQLTVHHPGWLTDSTCGIIAKWLKTKGYGFDFISDRQILAGKANSYKAIVVPSTKHIPLETLRKILSLADNDKQVVFLDSLPTDVPGFHNLTQRQATLKTLLKDRESLVVKTNALQQRLKNAKVIREPMTDAGLELIRRSHKDGYHYFVANMTAKPVDDWISLGVSFKSAVLMDPRSAETGVATQRNNKELYIQLRPGETCIIRTFSNKLINGPKWPCLIETGNKPMIVTGKWNVIFIDGGPTLPDSITTTKLKSWTILGDDEAKRFAGTGCYTIEFYLPKTKADDWTIDLGDVRESARVYINGKIATTLYCVPYRAPVGRFLKPGRNLLEIEVTNLSANRIRDLDILKVQWKIFHNANIVNHRYQKFDASKWDLTPSGLLGPVTLIPMNNYSP